ncbi:hypothetical protein [Rhodanobacter sp. C03]|uniref:hypothetical protein n=1 Tax=Rhodanobacter sp. C03 TaxID=1945858 RepID=UPI0009C6FA5D|nr:hypothetical protein [Rhodanobacter sp. C03]OOG53335.1 hypothetical protein B0E48_16205 [Rhodanobacter sp. C03]
MEQLGTKPKFWFQTDDGRLCLFKQSRLGIGEDWAEKVADELCTRLDLPHASYDLASWQGRRGVVTPSFVPPDGRLVFGNELLSFAVSGYDTAPKYRRQHHTIGRVFALLSGSPIQLPLGWVTVAQFRSAASVFIGYLMLDVLIGNQDRHDENWGLLVADGQIYLQPTFDHASSLGRNERDEVREERLVTRDKNRGIHRYVERATSALYATSTSEKPLSTLDAFVAGARHDPDAANYWLGKLNNLTFDEMARVVDVVQDDWMGPTAKKFALRMLELNKQRLSEIYL